VGKIFVFFFAPNAILPFFFGANTIFRYLCGGNRQEAGKRVRFDALQLF